MLINVEHKNQVTLGANRINQIGPRNDRACHEIPGKPSLYETQYVLAILAVSKISDAAQS